MTGSLARAVIAIPPIIPVKNNAPLACPDKYGLLYDDVKPVFR